MRPVSEFRANFAQAEPVTDGLPNGLADALTVHEADSTIRNLCFVWEDGRKAFFNYAYLVAADLTVQDGINALLLSFGSYNVLLKGYNLGPLFDALLEHSPKIITAINPRYVSQQESYQSVVIEIVVKND